MIHIRRKGIALIPFYLLFFITIHAQSDSIPDSGEQIANARQYLLVALQADDPAEVSLWRDSLLIYEDSARAGLVWDERWLMYYWEGSYGNMFDEVSRFDRAERQRQANMVKPPQDGLFEWLDSVLYAQRYDLYERIGRGFLTEEEKQFALIQLEYLLRLNQQDEEEWNKRLDNFIRLHPESRFKTYVTDNLYLGTWPRVKYKVRKDRGFTIDLLLSSGRWRGEMETTLRSPYGFDLGLAYWMNRWNMGLRCTFGWQKLSKPVYQEGFEWPRGDQSILLLPALEFGYDVINGRKLRLFPVATAGIGILKPPGSDEESDNPQPDYYSNFFFAKGYLGVALNADIKLLYFDSYDLKDNTENSHLDIRIRVGYNWLNWDNDNPALGGNMFYFAVGVNLFGHTLQ
ncbi:MAG: hypothetical protein H6565_14440 [Lewinellaceae bacterium]|nr:hypothetical protein [Lewinellaceae bacterium]MCB9356576.1 hypothetical protein [Lewinellaceae bacterium]